MGEILLIRKSRGNNDILIQSPVLYKLIASVLHTKCAFNFRLHFHPHYNTQLFLTLTLFFFPSYTWCCNCFMDIDFQWLTGGWLPVLNQWRQLARHSVEAQQNHQFYCYFQCFSCLLLSVIFVPQTFQTHPNLITTPPRPDGSFCILLQHNNPPWNCIQNRVIILGTDDMRLLPMRFLAVPIPYPTSKHRSEKQTVVEIKATISASGKKICVCPFHLIFDFLVQSGMYSKHTLIFFFFLISELFSFFFLYLNQQNGC